MLCGVARYGEVYAWKSSNALAVVKLGDENFGSVMLQSGRQLIDGFPTLATALAFNSLVAAHKKLFVGSPDLADMYDSVGGKALAQRIVNELKAKALKKEKPA